MIIKNWKQVITAGMIIVPALGTLYLSLAGLWDLPYGEQISGTCGALTVFLGVLVKISAASYDKTK